MSNIRRVAIIDDMTEVIAAFIRTDEVQFLCIKDSQAFPHIAPQEVTIHSRDDMKRLYKFIGEVLSETDEIDETGGEKTIGPDGLSEEEIDKMIEEAA